MPVFSQNNSTNGLNFFEVPSTAATTKKGENNLIGAFDKHGDLIWCVFYDLKLTQMNHFYYLASF